MTEPKNQGILEIARRNLAVRCSLLLGVGVACFAMVSPLAYWLHRGTGLFAAAIGIGLCLSGSLLSLLIAGRLQGPQFSANRLILGMMARMGLPIAAGLVINLRSQKMVEAGLPIYLIVFFLICLLIHTAVSLPTCQSAEGSAKDS